MSITVLGAVGVRVDGLRVPGLESLPRNDDDSVPGEALARFVAAFGPGDIDDEG